MKTTLRLALVTSCALALLVSAQPMTASADDGSSDVTVDRKSLTAEQRADLAADRAPPCEPDSQEDTIQAMPRPSRTPVVIAGAIVVGALGWLGGYAAAGLYQAGPVLYEREIPGLLAAILVTATLATAIVAAAIAVIAERLTRLTGPGRTRWRWAATFCYLAAAAASAAILLYQHYQYLEQYGG